MSPHLGSFSQRHFSIAAPQLQSNLSNCKKDAVAGLPSYSIHLPKRCNLNRWISCFLILSMLRLQLVICGCGAIDHFELSGNDLQELSSSRANCACDHHRGPIRDGSTNHQDKLFRGQWKLNTLSFVGVNCVGHEAHAPHQHHHSHRYQPKTRAEQRLDYLLFHSCASYWIPISACTRFLHSRQFHGPGVVSWLRLQTLVALLRI